MFDLGRYQRGLAAVLGLAVVAIAVVTFGHGDPPAEERPGRPPHPAVLTEPTAAAASRGEGEDPAAIRVLEVSLGSGADLQLFLRYGNLERLDVTLDPGAELLGLNGFPHLTEITLHRSSPGPLDLSDLSALLHLRRITLRNVRIERLDAFAGLPDLRSLTVLNGAVGDLSGIAAASHLESLILDNFPRSEGIPRNGDVFLGPALAVQDLDTAPALNLAPLGAKPDLRVLVVVGSRVSGLASLSQAPDLYALWLLRAGITDLTEIAGMRDLRTLMLAYNDQLDDIAPLEGLLNLENLNLRGTAVTDLGDIPALPALTRLDLRDTPLAEGQAEALPAGIEVRR